MKDKLIGLLYQDGFNVIDAVSPIHDDGTKMQSFKVEIPDAETEEETIVNAPYVIRNMIRRYTDSREKIYIYQLTNEHMPVGFVKIRMAAVFVG